jgi:hypothetical protein
MFDYNSLYPAVLAAMFPDPKLRRQADAILDGYGSDGSDREPERVHLAILKLAGPDLEAIKRNVGYALTDYRDVLAWAEYPNAIKNHSWRLADGSPEKIRLNAADRRQYQDWLDTLLDVRVD